MLNATVFMSMSQYHRGTVICYKVMSTETSSEVSSTNQKLGLQMQLPWQRLKYQDDFNTIKSADELRQSKQLELTLQYNMTE